MPNVTVHDTVTTALVTAFTIAAALIWKDVIMEFIELIVPPGQELLYKVIAAVIATIMVLIAIFIVLQTDKEAEYLVRRLKRR